MNLRSILLACLAAAKSAQAAPIKVACFGDSVTAGSKAKGKPWPKQIRSVLGRGFFDSYNFGKSGATVTDLGTDQSAPYIGSDQYDDWRAAVQDSCEPKDGCTRSPFQVGIISLGTNDAKKQNLPSNTTFIEAYKSLITNIVQDLYEPDDDDPDDGGACPGGGSDLQLLVLASAVPIAGPPIRQTDRTDWNEASKTWVADTLPGLVKNVSKWADDEFDLPRVEYVNLYEILSSRGDYPGSLYDDDDRIHPNRDGHAVIAAALGAKVQEWCDEFGECDQNRAGCGGDESTFYPVDERDDCPGDECPYQIDSRAKPYPYDVSGFATFGGITSGGYDADSVVKCNVECDTDDCFEDAVERNGDFEVTRGKPLVVCLTGDIVTTSKNEPKGDEGSLTIDGQGHTISYGRREALNIRGASNIVIKDVHFKNVDAGKEKSAVKISEGAHHFFIQSCTFSCDSSSNCDDTDAAVEVEDATFITIDKCKFDGVDRAVYVRNDEDDCDGHGAGRVTISESVFLNVRRETPRVQVGWVHVYNSLWIGGGDDNGMVRVDPKKGAKPEIFVEACSFKEVDDAYENDDDGIGTIAESAVNMDSNSRDDAATAYAPGNLSFCVPYDYDVVDASDPAAMQRIRDAAGAAVADAPTAVPTAEPSAPPSKTPTGEPTAEPTVCPEAPRRLLTNCVTYPCACQDHPGKCIVVGSMGEGGVRCSHGIRPHVTEEFCNTVTETKGGFCGGDGSGGRGGFVEAGAFCKWTFCPAPDDEGRRLDELPLTAVSKAVV